MSEPIVVTDSSLSNAWAKAFVRSMSVPRQELSPLILTVTGFNDGIVEEAPAIRTCLDKSLREAGIHSCQTVANTIFPEHLWYPGHSGSADVLYAAYDRIWPRIKRDRRNYRGVYFRRLTAYQPKGNDSSPVNQLREVIATYRNGNHRRSALQAAIFDPTRDHTGTRQLGFPCLQQVAFTPFGDHALAVGAFYPTQLLFERGYGNYLGIARLGRFMASEMGLRLARVSCVTIVAKGSELPKKRLTELAAEIGALLPSASGA